MQGSGSPGTPSWDGGRILFEVADGTDRVACTISVGALQDMSGQRRFNPADLLSSFAMVRARVEAIALGKFRLRPAGATGLVHVWSDDIDDAEAMIVEFAEPTATAPTTHPITPVETGHGQGPEAKKSRSEEA